VLTGCNKIAEKTGEAAVEKMIEAETGGDVDVDVSGEKITFHDEDGSTTTVVGEDTTLPEGWPAGLPQYPGSKLELANTATADDGIAMTVFMTATDDPAKVAEFYAGKAAAMGMKQVTKMVHGEMVTAHYQSAEWMLNLGCGAQEDGTGITLMLSPGDGTVPEANS
jgi:hypothetical protein